MVEAVLLSVVGAVSIGAGWILQWRVVDSLYRERGDQPTGLSGLLTVIRKPIWWAGIAAMTIGQTATGVALQRGTLTLVAPLLSTNLLCAFLLQSAALRHRPPKRDVLGACGFAISVIGFVLIGGPHVTHGGRPSGLVASIIGTMAVAAAAFLLLAAGLRRGVAVVSITAAVAAGLLYGLQDVATRAGLVLQQRHGLPATLASVWPYLLLGAATAAVLATQRALRHARLDYAVPPIAATQPVVGVILGVALLGDHLALDTASLAVEAACLTLLIVSTVLLSRSAALTGATPREVTASRR